MSKPLTLKKKFVVPLTFILLFGIPISLNSFWKIDNDFHSWIHTTQTESLGSNVHYILKTNSLHQSLSIVAIGFQISQNRILTTAHGLKNLSPYDILLTPDLKHFSHGKKFIFPKSDNRDFAIIELKTELHLMKPEFPKKSGYYIQLPIKANSPTFIPLALSKEAVNQFTSETELFQGQSGAPIWNINSNQTPNLIGLLKSKTSSKSASEKKPTYIFEPIDSEVENLMIRDSSSPSKSTDINCNSLIPIEVPIHEFKLSHQTRIHKRKPIHAITLINRNNHALEIVGFEEAVHLIKIRTQDFSKNPNPIFHSKFPVELTPNQSITIFIEQKIPQSLTLLSNPTP